MSADPFHPLASGDTALFYRAAIGVRGQGYHLPRFLRFDEAGQTGLSWNWAASLFTFNWLVYRKMWGWALAYVGALALAGLLVFGVGKLVFDYSGALAWMLGLWLLSVAYIVPGLYANVWLYGHYNDKISDVLRKSSGVVDTISRLTAVAPGPHRLGRQLLANVLVLVALLAPVLAMQDWQRLGNNGAVLAWLAPVRDALRKEPSAPEPAPAQAAAGPVVGAGSGAVTAGASAAGVLTQAAPPAPAAMPIKAVDDTAARPVVAFEPAFDTAPRPARPGADRVPVASFAANPVAPPPLNAPLPAPFSTSAAVVPVAPSTPPADLVPLQEVLLPPTRPQVPPAAAPRARQLAQADAMAAPGAPGNTARGVVTQSVTPVPALSSAAPLAPATPAAPRRAAPAVAAEGEKPQASARLRAASQAAQAKRAAQPQGGAVTASAAPQSGAGAPPPRSTGSASWVVQAGVFRQADNAHRVVSQLQAMGIEAALESFPNNRGEAMLRVVAGPYTEQAQARQAAQRIQARSLPAMVMREAR